MSENSTSADLRRGLRLAGLVLIFLATAGLFFAGVDYLFFPAGHSRLLGLAFLVLSTSVMIFTMDRWIRALVGVLAFGVLNGAVTLATGHLLGNPAQPVPRLDALCFTVFFTAATVLSSNMRGRVPSLVDRILVLGFAFTLAYMLGYGAARTAGMSGRLSSTEFALMGLALSFLVGAWVIDRTRPNSHVC